MTYYVGTMPVGEHLSHHGIKGMKWGQRRYQNPDGSLTAAGRARYGVSNAYGRARSGIRSAGNRTSSWYKRNKKTIKKVGIAVGAGAAAAGATYLGMRYGKTAVRAAKRLGRAAPFKARALGNKARTTYAKGVVNTRHAGRNLKTGFGNVARTAGARASAFKAKNKLARSSANAYRKYGIVGTNLRKGDKAFIDAGNAARKAGSQIKSNARKSAIKAGFKANALGYKAKATYAKGVVGAKGVARKAGATAKKAASQAKFDAGRKLRAASYKTKTAKAKAVVGVKNTARKAKSATKNAASSVKRKRRISRTVNNAFNSPSRYFGTHTNKQIRRDAARNLGLQVGAAFAGDATGRAIVRRSNKKKKSRK